MVIGADGAGSVVRRALGHAPNPDRHLALAIRGYATYDGLAEQRIVTSGPRWPAYAWAFPIGDGRANVGYGEVLRGQPLSRAHLLDRLAALLPEVDLPAVDSLRAHHLPLSTSRRQPGDRAGPARRRRPVADQPVHRRGHLLRRALRRAGRRGGGGNARRRRPGRTPTPLRRRLGRHLRHSAAAAWLARRPSVVDAAVRAAGRDRGVFDSIVELGLGDGLLDPRTLGHIARALAVRS